MQFFDEADERANKNLYCSADEIDVRQAGELLALLEKFMRQEIAAVDLLADAEYVVGAHCMASSGYRLARDFCGKLGTDREHELLQQFRDVSTSIDEIRTVIEKNLIDSRAKLEKLFRMDILQSTPAADDNIRNLRNMIMNADIDSWDAAVAIAEILFDPTLLELTHNPSLPHAELFREDVARKKAECQKEAPEPSMTLKVMTPQTEKELKDSLARRFTHEKAFKAWAAAQKARGVKDGDITRWNWDIRHYRPGAPADDEEIAFRSPLDFPDRVLCKEIHVFPTGTALIRPDDDMEDLEIIYGTRVARITTYTISFVPANPDDTELVRKLVEEALDVLAMVPYDYLLPEHDTPSGAGYKRPRKPDYRSEFDSLLWANFAGTRDGRVTPHLKLDLDDLYILYYILEPMIEANPQVATAMNSARFAEERGAILKPDPFNYISAGHQIENLSGTFKKDAPDEVLAGQLNDAFVDFTLGKIDLEGFSVRITTLAGHTLNGGIADPTGAFPTYVSLLEDAHSSKGNLVTYDEALIDRGKAFGWSIATMVTGLKPESGVPLGHALMMAKSQAAPHIRDAARAAHKQDMLDHNARYNDWYQEHIRNRARWDFADLARNTVVDSENGGVCKVRDFADYLSDQMAGTAGLSEEERSNRRKNALTHTGNLVVSDSAVETCIDGVHENGRYVTKTRGSIFVRKELPEALKPFVAQGGARPETPVRLLAELTRR